MRKLILFLILSLFLTACAGLVPEKQPDESEKIVSPHVIVNDEILSAIADAIDNDKIAGERITDVTYMTDGNKTVIQVEVHWGDYRKQLVSIFKIMYEHAYADEYNVKVRQTEFRDYVYECISSNEWIETLIEENLHEDDFYRELTVYRWYSNGTSELISDVKY